MEIDSLVPRSPLGAKSAVRFKTAQRMVNGMKSNVLNQSEVIRLLLRPQEKTIYQFQELKFTQPNVPETVAEEYLDQ